MPSNHLILCRPLLLLPSIFPNIRVFSNESALRIRWPKYWSFSFNISPSNEHPGLISFRMPYWPFNTQHLAQWSELKKVWESKKNHWFGHLDPEDPVLQLKKKHWTNNSYPYFKFISRETAYQNFKELRFKKKNNTQQRARTGRTRDI